MRTPPFILKNVPTTFPKTSTRGRMGDQTGTSLHLWCSYLDLSHFHRLSSLLLSSVQYYHYPSSGETTDGVSGPTRLVSGRLAPCSGSGYSHFSLCGKLSQTLCLDPHFAMVCSGPRSGTGAACFAPPGLIVLICHTFPKSLVLSTLLGSPPVSY